LQVPDDDISATSPANSAPTASSTTPDIVVYWRPGCGFCSSLMRRLDKAEMVYEKRNIWENPDDAAFVRSVARGNETVPTVIAKGKSMVNPSLEDIAQALVS
jgi:mycoredoxin